MKGRAAAAGALATDVAEDGADAGLGEVDVEVELFEHAPIAVTASRVKAERASLGLSIPNRCGVWVSRCALVGGATNDYGLHDQDVRSRRAGMPSPSSAKTGSCSPNTIDATRTAATTTIPVMAATRW